ncbi:hypothetical protein ACFL2M_00945 [Patescibacteria group bacterium]
MKTLQKQLNTVKKEVNKRFKVAGKFVRKHRRFQPVFLVLVAAILFNVLVPHVSFSETGDKLLRAMSNVTPVVDEGGKIRLPIFIDADGEKAEPRLPDIEKIEQPKAIKTYWSQVTVYNSVPWQTQGDPFVTASGERVRDGIVAANCMPFGTKLRMPDRFGDKIFVVKDRLSAEKSCYIIDIWQEYSPDNPSFGAPVMKIEILEGSPAQNLSWVYEAPYEPA